MKVSELEKKELNVRAYAHHAFVDAILNEGSNELCVFNIVDYSKYDWNVSKKNTDIICSEESITIIGEPYLEERSACITRDCYSKDNIEVLVCSQCYCNDWGSITLFVNDDFGKSICEFGNFSRKELFLSFNGENIPLGGNKYRVETTYPLKIRILVDEKKLKVQYKLLVQDLEWITCYEMTGNKTVCSIGVKINLSNSQYYNWLFSNFLVLKLDCDNYIPLDYNNAPQKNWDFHSINPLLDIKKDTRYSIKNYGINIVEYTLTQLKQGNYVEVILNEKYVVDRSAFKEMDMDHQNLVYGYDENTSKFYIMGYNQEGKLSYSQISYDDYIHAYSCCSYDHDNYIYSISNDKGYYNFNPNCFCQELNYYKKCENNLLPLNRFYNVSDANIFYGLDIYNGLLKENVFNKFMNDLRMSYIILEHKKLMLKRLHFLRCRNIITQSQYDQFKGEVVILCDISKVINQLVIKNLLVSSNNNLILSKVKMHLVKLCDKERKFINAFFDCIKRFCENME